MQRATLHILRALFIRSLLITLCLPGRAARPPADEPRKELLAPCVVYSLPAPARIGEIFWQTDDRLLALTTNRFDKYIGVWLHLDRRKETLTREPAPELDDFLRDCNRWSLRVSPNGKWLLGQRLGSKTWRAREIDGPGVQGWDQRSWRGEWLLDSSAWAALEDTDVSASIRWPETERDVVVRMASVKVYPVPDAGPPRPPAVAGGVPLPSSGLMGMGVADRSHVVLITQSSPVEETYRADEYDVRPAPLGGWARHWGPVKFEGARFVEAVLSPKGSVIAWQTVTPLKPIESSQNPVFSPIWHGVKVRLWITEPGEARARLIHERDFPDMWWSALILGDLAQTGPSKVRWNPDGSRLAYVAEGKLVVVTRGK